MADIELVLCVPCQSTGEPLPAVKYCINCSEPLCKQCVAYHMKFGATKSHKLVDCSTHDTRHFKGAKQLSVYMTCPDHDDSTVKLLCDEHGTLCCLTCATTTHRNCRRVSEINKLAAGCKTSGQIDKIKTRLEKTGTCMQEIIDVNDACRIDFENSKDEIPQRLEEIKRKILKLFERMESAVIETVKNLHMDEDIAMGNREENWKLKLNANVELLEMLDAITEIGTESQVFVALQKMKSTLSKTEKALSDQGSHIVGQGLKLQFKDNLENFMQTDVIDNLVVVETIQNQYQLPSTVAYSKPGYDVGDMTSTSDSVPDCTSEEKTTESSGSKHSLCEMKKKEELAELLHKAEIEKTARESGNMQSEESEHSEITTADSVGETYTKQTGTGQSQHSSAQKSNAETSKLTGKPEAEQTKQTDVDGTESSDLADKGSGSEETYAYRFIAMEHCLADFIMLQKDISDLKTRLNVRIIYNCGKIIVFGDREEQLKEALRKITSLAEASYVDFILKTNPFKKDSDEWQAIEKEANVSNVAISIRSIEHKPLRDKEYYKVGKVEICVGHGCIGDIKRVDMIVLPVNRFFFPITPASELFFNKGGHRLLEETNNMSTKYMTKNKNQHPPIGFLHISDVVGNLPCKYIAYIVVGEIIAEDVYIEKKLMRKLCYILEDDVNVRKQTTIALPLELSRTFPVQTSSKIIADAIKQATTNKTTQLKGICLCAENVDNLKLAKKVFREEFRQLDENEMVIVDIYDDIEEQQNHVKVEVVTGSLVDQKVDAIVCIVNEWDLRHGAVAKEILDKGGEKIEQDLKRCIKPCSLGDVFALKAGNLPCGHIIFGSLPCLREGNESYVLEVQISDERLQDHLSSGLEVQIMTATFQKVFILGPYVLCRNLKLFLMNCFKTAKISKCHSLAFPVLGTGKMKYPVSMVAKEMLRAAHFYAAQNGVDQVKIVLLKDDPNLKLFSELNIRFQAMQKDLVKKEDSWKYLDVKIGGCQMKITVVEGIDHEAFASNIIVRSVRLEQGGKAWDVKEDEPNPNVLNTVYFLMYLRPYPTEYDFKACLSDVLCKLEKKGHVYITLDFSQGLECFYNYIQLTIEALKLRSYSLKAVEKLTIVSDEGMFQELLTRCSDSQTEAADVTFTEKVSRALASFWSKQAVTITLKEHKKKPYGGAQTSWLTVLCAIDPQKLQTIRQKIDNYCKKSVGSSVDDRKLNSQTLSLTENSERKKDTARALTSGTKGILPEDEKRKSIEVEDFELWKGYDARGSTDLTGTGDSTDLNETGESADLSDSGESTELDEEDSGDEKSLEPTGTVPAPVVDISSNSLERRYQTNEGITVKVYKGNITRLPVDCIVNAANEHLGHGAGVAAAISRAAGPDFQQESDHKVQMHGRVSVTRCTKTSAGSLNYKCVIHAVGPRFSQYTSSTHDAYDLKSTIINALKMAEEEGITSVALPSISADIFGGTPDLCADMYARGVLDFSRSNQGRHSLNEIHFVDIQESLVQTIQSKFDFAFTLMKLDSSSKSVTSGSIRA